MSSLPSSNLLLYWIQVYFRWATNSVADNRTWVTPMKVERLPSHKGSLCQQQVIVGGSPGLVVMGEDSCL